MEFNCKYRELNSTIGGTIYSSIVTLAWAPEKFKDVKAIKGEHKFGSSNSDVRILSFVSLQIHFIPSGLPGIYGNLTEIYITSCGLKEISRIDLSGFKNLELLALRYNDLKSLPDDLFQDMRKLSHVWIDEHKLEFLSKKVFSPLMSKLETLKLNNSSISLYYDRQKSPRNILRNIMDAIDKQFKAEDCKHQMPFSKGQQKELWESGKFSDFTIIAEDKEFKAYKFVLASSSSVFAAMFESETIEGQLKVITIEGFSARAIKDFITFLHTREPPGEINAMEVFALASKYNVDQLKTISLNMILKNINELNAIYIMDLGKEYTCEYMMRHAFECIRKAQPEINFPDHFVYEPEKIKQVMQARARCEALKEATQMAQNQLDELMR